MADHLHKKFLKPVGLVQLCTCLPCVPQLLDKSCPAACCQCMRIRFFQTIVFVFGLWPLSRRCEALHFANDFRNQTALLQTQILFSRSAHHTPKGHLVSLPALNVLPVCCAEQTRMTRNISQGVWLDLVRVDRHTISPLCVCCWSSAAQAAKILAAAR